MLERLGADTGSRLPTLDGFVTTERDKLQNLERPYYEYKLNLVAREPDRTEVEVKANVSAWFADPVGTRTGYQVFNSNGRLESDLLDRLEAALTKTPPGPQALSREIQSVKQQRVDIQSHIASLETQIKELSTSPADQSAAYVEVTRPRTPIFTSPNEKSAKLFTVGLEDELEIADRQSAWIKVKLDGNREGWLRRSETKVISAGDDGSLTSKDGASGFTVQRETIATFSGDWPRLQNKNALYVWVRPDGSPLNAAPGAKLRFARQLFKLRYRRMLHSPEDPAAGIVVIFLDAKGGVAAASADDIALWQEGSLSESSFVGRCSLDPRSSFAGPTAQPRTGKRSASGKP